MNAELEKLEAKLKSNLKEKEMRLKNDLAIYISKLVNQLKRELLMEMSIPEDLRTYLMTWETSTISSLLQRLNEDMIKRGNALRQRLTYIGMSEQQFFALMDIYEKGKSF